MAGKHIYIETILDNLLGGFQTTFDKMIAALDRMIGKTEEDPDGTSLKNVVEGLEEITGKTAEDPGKNLSEVVAELEAVVSSIAASSAVINVKPGQTQHLDLKDLTISGQTTTVEMKYKSNVQGVLTFGGYLTLGVSLQKMGNLYVYVNDVEVFHVRRYITNPEFISKNIIVSRNDIIKIALSTEAAFNATLTDAMFEYDLGASLIPEDLFVEV